MKTVLFPTDFSMNSKHAIRYMLNMMASESNMQYILVNAYTDPSAGASMTRMWSDHMRQVSQDMLSKFVQEIRENYGFPNFEPQLLSQYGDLPNALWPIIKNQHVDLVVMGSSGASGPSPSIIGSNAYATMKGVQCPVLTVPLQAPIKAPYRIGLASASKLNGSEMVLEPLHDMASMVNAWVMGVTVSGSKGQEEALESAIDRGVESDLDYIDIADDDPVLGIEAAVGEHDLDMVAVILKKRGFIERLFHKSISKQVAAQIAIPLLTLHEEELNG